uniref:Uncharacterized protein n=1 Tax=uncultured Planctomycetota bacterium TaxID=120965 RepID=H5SC97_9BACT|nr:hypothetical protein HGMM_F08F10C02 [uncultured Planctomycetota bacterium]
MVLSALLIFYAVANSHPTVVSEDLTLIARLEASIERQGEELFSYKELRIRVISTKDGDTVKLIHLKVPSEKYHLYKIHEHPTVTFTFAPHHPNELIYADTAGDIYRVDIAKDSTPTFLIRSPGIRQLVRSPDGRYLAIVRRLLPADRTYEVAVLHYPNLKHLRTFRTRDDTDAPPPCVFSMDCAFFAYAENDVIYIWKLHTDLTWVLDSSTDKIDGDFFSLAFAPDNRVIAGYDRDGEVRFWDINNRRVVGRMQLCSVPGYFVKYVTFGGRQLLLLDSGYDLYCFDAKTYRQLWKINRWWPDSIEIDKAESMSDFYIASMSSKGLIVTENFKKKQVTLQEFDLLTGRPTTTPKTLK